MVIQMARILIVDAEEQTTGFLARSLMKAGYQVDACTTGATALEQLATEAHEAVILDLALDDVPGLDVVRAIRAQRNAVPVLALTARSGLEARVEGLEAGCDDYLTKPYAMQELLARLKALKRRAHDHRVRVLIYGDLQLNLDSRVARRGDRSIPLTNREFALLESLMRHPEQVLSRLALHERIWSIGGPMMSNSLEVYVTYLRRKIESESERRLLHTVRGIGYVLCADNVPMDELSIAPSMDQGAYAAFDSAHGNSVPIGNPGGFTDR